MDFRKILTKLLGKLLEQKLPLAIVAISPILTTVFLSAHTYFAKLLADPTGNIAVLTTALSLILLPLPWAVYFWFKPIINYDSNLNIYRDIKTGIYYCASCKVKNILSPLAKHDAYWRCSLKEYRLTYDDPNYVPPIKEAKPYRAFYV